MNEILTRLNDSVPGINLGDAVQIPLFGMKFVRKITVSISKSMITYNYHLNQNDIDADSTMDFSILSFTKSEKTDNWTLMLTGFEVNVLVKYDEESLYMCSKGLEKGSWIIYDVR